MIQQKDFTTLLNEKSIISSLFKSILKMRIKIFLLILIISFAEFSYAKEIEKIPVAFIAGFSEKNPIFSNELYRGAELYLAVNPNAKDKIDLIKYDNKGDPETTIRILEEINKKGIKIIVGIINSNQAVAASKYAEEHKLLFITPFSNSEKITLNKKYSFSTSYSDNQEGRVQAEQAKKFNLKKILILINQDSLYSVGVSASFIKNLDESQTYEKFYYPKNDAPIEKIKEIYLKMNPDVIYIPDHTPTASLIIKYINAGDKIKILGGGGFGGKKLFHGIYSREPNMDVIYTMPWDKNIQTKRNKEFILAYKKKYKGEMLAPVAATSFDAFSILFHALEKNNFNSDPDTLIYFLKNRTFEIIAGKIKFNENAVAYSPIVVINYKNGNYQLLEVKETNE